MTTLFMHHYFVPQKSYGYTYLTNFHEEFDNADHIGTDAIKETFHRLFNQCKDNGPLVKELSYVLNLRIAFWDEKNLKEPSNPKFLELATIYLDLYEWLRRYLLSKNYPFTRKRWQIIE